MYAVPNTPHAISREQLLDQLEVLRKRAIRPEEGLYGPGSMSWEIGKHSVTFMGAGRAALLQLAHPWVANAITQHSKTVSDPFGRFRRTFTNVFTMTFGSVDQLLDCCIAVHNIHSTMFGKIATEAGAHGAGSAYQANEVNAMLWVHATLWDTSVRMYEMFVRPLSMEEKERYYQETKLFAFCFGIPEAALPETWGDFLAYNEAMWNSDQLAVGPEALEIASFLFNFHPLARPAMKPFEVFTGMVMPERLREAFLLPAPTDKNLASFDRMVKVIRRVHPLLPRRLQYLPPYVEARRRLRGLHEPDMVTSLMTRAMLGTPKLVS
ncbi:MAG: oxygenase MpaB family protein [Moraxellaceae bacterium]|nr:oxygenase MpaB family protein [Moraxellaceae bacterium]